MMDDGKWSYCGEDNNTWQSESCEEGRGDEPGTCQRDVFELDFEGDRDWSVQTDECREVYSMSGNMAEENGEAVLKQVEAGEEFEFTVGPSGADCSGISEETFTIKAPKVELEEFSPPLKTNEESIDVNLVNFSGGSADYPDITYKDIKVTGAEGNNINTDDSVVGPEKVSIDPRPGRITVDAVIRDNTPGDSLNATDSTTFWYADLLKRTFEGERSWDGKSNILSYNWKMKGVYNGDKASYDNWWGNQEDNWAYYRYKDVGSPWLSGDEHSGTDYSYLTLRSNFKDTGGSMWEKDHFLNGTEATYNERGSLPDEWELKVYRGTQIRKDISDEEWEDRFNVIIRARSDVSEGVASEIRFFQPSYYHGGSVGFDLDSESFRIYRFKYDGDKVRGYVKKEGGWELIDEKDISYPSYFGFQIGSQGDTISPNTLWIDWIGVTS